MQVNTGCCSAMRGECVAAVNACRLIVDRRAGVSEVEGYCCAVLCCVVGWSRGRLGGGGQVGWMWADEIGIEWLFATQNTHTHTQFWEVWDGGKDEEGC